MRMYIWLIFMIVLLSTIGYAARVLIFATLTELEFLAVLMGLTFLCYLWYRTISD